MVMIVALQIAATAEDRHVRGTKGTFGASDADDRSSRKAIT